MTDPNRNRDVDHQHDETAETRFELENQLQQRERALHRAYEIIADPDRSFSQQVDDLLNVAREAVGTDYATLSHVHDDEYVFEAVATPDDADLQAGDTVPLEATNCERVVETERLLVLDDVAVDAPELADRAGNAEWGISCYLGAPVIVDGEVYGSFCFYDMEARSVEFSDWQGTFVELLSDWVGSELERQRQHARLESFAGMLAHELRNPLQIAQLYHQQAIDGDEAAGEKVANALDRIEEMIDVMLVTARGADSAIDAEPVAVADVAAEAWANVGIDEAELAVETDRIIETNRTHLQHLLENLFKNAVEHGSASSQPGGDATQQRSEMSADAIQRTGTDVTILVGDLPTGFYVADDGPGIPTDERGHVFEPGYTTDQEGIGLGLTLVEQLAETYGWKSTVTESDAGGARFEFTNVELVGEG